MAKAKRETLILPVEALQSLGLPLDTELSFTAGRVRKISTPKGAMWVKAAERIPAQKKRRFLLGALSMLPASALAITIGKGVTNLAQQADQAEVLRKSGFNTPETIFLNGDFYITTDGGQSLTEMFLELNARGTFEEAGQADALRFEEILLTATQELSKLHTAGLAHGRPKVRDFSWLPDNAAAGISSPGRIFLLDLEERPWEVMSMADAQARDICLWMIDMCQIGVPEHMASNATTQLLSAISAPAAKSLRQIMRVMAFISPFVQLALKSGVSSRDLRAGLKGYRLLKAHFPSMPA